jgi:hypothetical protein
MDGKARKALISELAVPKNFDPNYYEQANRSWFVDKLIRVFEDRQTPDDQIEQKVRDVVSKSKAIVAAKRDFQLRLSLEKTYEAASRKRRVEILYGAIATDPEFAEPAYAAFLDFIAARRLRGVARMDLFINDDRLGYFLYPQPCGQPYLTWAVNADARPDWEPVLSDFATPLRLKAAVTDASAAIDKLWRPRDVECDRNLFDCATAMSCLLMDTLREARDATVLLGHVRGRSDHHLMICHPNVVPSGLVPNAHFLWDGAQTRLFTKENVLPEDLQVGDHVYIMNHPIYSGLDPTGFWNGEHAIVSDLGDRTLNGIQLSGHGIPQSSANQLVAQLVKTVQGHVQRLYNQVLLFLKFMNPGSTSIPPETPTVPPESVQRDQVMVPTGPTTTALADRYRFDVAVKSMDFSNTPAPQTDPAGFEVLFFPSADEFLVRPKGLVVKRPFLGTLLKRQGELPPGADRFDPARWSLLYDPDPSGQIKPPPLPLFTQKRNGVVTIRQFRRDDLPAFPLGKLKASDKGGLVTRPTVLSGTPYQDFLEAQDAI